MKAVEKDGRRLLRRELPPDARLYLVWDGPVTHWQVRRENSLRRQGQTDLRQEPPNQTYLGRKRVGLLGPRPVAQIDNETVRRALSAGNGLSRKGGEAI